MNATQIVPPPIQAWKSRSAMLALGGVVLCLLALLGGSESFFRSYLLSYAFWIIFPLGSLGVMMMHNLTGGKWGQRMRPYIETNASTMVLMALLFLPLLAGFKTLYPWANEELRHTDHLLHHRAAWMNPTAAVIRAVLYFAFFIGWPLLLKKLKHSNPGRFRGMSGFGLVLFAFVVTFSSMDWMMSRETSWFSSIYPAIWAVGGMLANFAGTLVIYAWLERRSGVKADRDAVHDIGKLAFAFTVLWTYMSFMQFLIVWSGNLPEENEFYVTRAHDGWQWMAAFIGACGFFVPFLGLLSARYKRNLQWSGGIVGVWILVMRFVDIYWLLAPSFGGSALTVHWTDFPLVIGMGCLWAAFFFWKFPGENAVALEASHS